MNAHERERDELVHPPRPCCVPGNCCPECVAWREPPTPAQRMRAVSSTAQAAMLRAAIASAQHASQDGRPRWLSAAPGQRPRAWVKRWAAAEDAGPDGRLLGPVHAGGSTHPILLGLPKASQDAIDAVAVMLSVARSARDAAIAGGATADEAVRAGVAAATGRARRRDALTAAAVRS